MLTLSNEKIKVKVIFTAFDSVDDYNDAVESVLRATAADPIIIDFTNNENGEAILEGPDQVCEDAIDLLRYHGFTVIDSESIPMERRHRRRTAAMRNLRKAA